MKKTKQKLSATWEILPPQWLRKKIQHQFYRILVSAAIGMKK